MHKWCQLIRDFWPMEGWLISSGPDQMIMENRNQREGPKTSSKTSSFCEYTSSNLTSSIIPFDRLVLTSLNLRKCIIVVHVFALFRSSMKNRKVAWNITMKWYPWFENALKWTGDNIIYQRGCTSRQPCWFCNGWIKVRWIQHEFTKNVQKWKKLKQEKPHLAEFSLAVLRRQWRRVLISLLIALMIHWKLIRSTTN